jgi:2-polyprenyl-6-methoxyphenol hydroxylase-like FAD-dependent oxidoreductase
VSEISRVLVVGGGIGGLTAAIALRQAGISTDLVEIKPSWSVYGVGIIQPNNTLRALERIGLAQACVDHGAAFPGWRIFDSRSQFLMDAPATNRAAPKYPPNNGITRPLLQQILTEAAYQNGTSIRLGTTVSALEQQDSKVRVAFSDGRQDHYDLVVASDGIYSQTRRRLFGEARQPGFAGQAVWRYNLPRPSHVEWGELFFGPDSKAGLVPLSPTLMYLLLVTKEPSNAELPAAELAPLMRKRMMAYSGFAAELREQVLDSSAVVYRPIEHLMMPSPWFKGRVLLIGDAAHAATPHLAQGAAMAIEDAVLLGELLSRTAPVHELLGEFMQRRFHRAKYVSDCSTQLATWELEEWAGIKSPSARPGPLLHEATLALMADY